MIRPVLPREMLAYFLLFFRSPSSSLYSPSTSLMVCLCVCGVCRLAASELSRRYGGRFYSAVDACTLQGAPSSRLGLRPSPLRALLLCSSYHNIGTTVDTMGLGLAVCKSSPWGFIRFQSLRILYFGSMGAISDNSIDDFLRPLHSYSFGLRVLLSTGQNKPSSSRVCRRVVKHKEEAVHVRESIVPYVLLSGVSYSIHM